MTNKKEVFHHHKNFGDLSKEELNLYLDFLSNALFNLNGFEVWEAENVFGKEESDIWNKKAVEVFTHLIEEKTKLENKIYGNF